jgi:hypothetical protein
MTGYAGDENGFIFQLPQEVSSSASTDSRRGARDMTPYFTTVFTTFIVISVLIVVPFCVFRTTKTHVIVHLYPVAVLTGGIRKVLKPRFFNFAKISDTRDCSKRIDFERLLPILGLDRGLKQIQSQNRRRTPASPPRFTD